MIRMLIVDDEPHIRAGIAAKIEQAGDPHWAVSGEAANGVEAMDWLQENYADICLTDIRMHAMDGLQLIQEVQGKYPWMQWFIISSYDDFSYAKQAMKLGVADYVLKPIERQALYDALRKSELQLQRNRQEKANDILLDRMQQLQGLLAQWSDAILANPIDKYALLIKNTVDLLENWVGKEPYLLEALSHEFIIMVGKQVKSLKGEPVPATIGELGLDTRTLTHAQSRDAFRKAATSVIENSVKPWIHSLKLEQQFQNPRIVNQIKRYLDDHYADKITLEELAKRTAISRSYLTVLFKQDTGKTVWEYLMDVRMEKAKRLLQDHKLKIYELANRIGYENGEHFAKLFKEYCGVTPKEYRRALELNQEQPSD